MSENARRFGDSIDVRRCDRVDRLNHEIRRSNNTASDSARMAAMLAEHLNR